MTQRINFAKLSPELFKKFLSFTNALGTSSLGGSLLDLVTIRISQMNGCDFSVELHVKQAKLRGESERRLSRLSGWRDSELYTPKEKAALAWTEILTELPKDGVPDDVFVRVREELTERELSDLSFAVAAINGWDRINIGFDTQFGRPSRE